MGKIFPRPGRLCVWSIGIYSGKSPFQLTPHAGCSIPTITANDVTDCKADFVADPFLWRETNEWYLFFEVLNAKTCLGEIAWARSNDLVAWRYGGVIVRQKTHMSYPYVFEHGGRKFMVPETYAQGNVALYRADSFPDGWKLDRVLIDEPLYDSSLILHEGVWYLFGSNAEYDLRLFYADSLFGVWAEHPMSPVIKKNAQFARAGGRIIAWNGDLYRFSQDCRGTYGVAVYGIKITRLNPREYCEEPIIEPIIAGSGSGWNAAGMHTVCAHGLGSDNWVAVVDGYYKRWGIKRY